MAELVASALAFPTVIFTGLLIVVLVYWAFVFIGALDIDLLDGGAEGLDGAADGALDGAADGLDVDVDVDVDVDMDMDMDMDMDADADADADAHGGGGGLLGTMGLAGVPVTVSFSFLILYCWALCMALGWLVAGLGLGGALFTLASLAAMLVAIVVAVPAAAVSVRPLKGLFVTHQAPRRAEFVGRVCIVTTQRVTDRFGQAEIVDGGTVLRVQARCTSENTLGKDSKALVIDYDRKNEVYIIVPMDEAS